MDGLGGRAIISGMHRQKGERKFLMYDRENDNRNNEGRQVQQQELEEPAARLATPTMTDAFARL